MYRGGKGKGLTTSVTTRLYVARKPQVPLLRCFQLPFERAWYRTYILLLPVKQGYINNILQVHLWNVEEKEINFTVCTSGLILFLLLIIKIKNQ